MKINFSNEVKLCERLLSKKVAKKVLKTLGQPTNVEICVSIVIDQHMRELNARTRGVDSVTDVLSFPALNLEAGETIDQSKVLAPGGIIQLGDVVVCRSQIERQAKEYGVSYRDEFVRMVLHSILHLLGYDHIDPKDAEKMHEVELPLLEKLVK